MRVQAYYNMQLVGSYSSKSSEWQGPKHAYQSALEALDAQASKPARAVRIPRHLAQNVSSEKLLEDKPAGLGSSASARGGLGGGSDEEGGIAQSGRLADAPGSNRGAERDETYDPPKNQVKAGAKAHLPGGLAVFWPRMPCLRCGCPWWLGEDWDARLACILSQSGLPLLLNLFSCSVERACCKPRPPNFIMLHLPEAFSHSLKEAR